MEDNYEFHRIVGMKIEFFPKIYSPDGNTNPNVRTICIGSEASGSDTAVGAFPTVTQMTTRKDFKAYPPA